MTNKQAQYEPKFSRLWERYDEACHGNAEQMRDILEVALDALETAERHIFNLEAQEVILPKLPTLGSDADWYQGFAAGAEGMRNDCLLAITAAGFSADRIRINGEE